jgi:putative sigma-54 modulation protein
MTPRISVRSGKLSDAAREHIDKACEKLPHFCDRIIDCEVIVDKQKLSVIVEFIVKVPNQKLVASAHNEDENLFKAIDEAESRLERQLKRYHDKLVDHR